MNESSPVRRFDDQLVSAKIVSPLTIGVGLLLGFDFWQGQTFTHDGRVIAVMATMLVLFAISHYIKVLQFGKLHLIYLVIYHISLAGLLIFVVPTLSHYLYVWIILTFMSEFFYQAKGTFLSLAALLATVLGGFAYQQHGMTKMQLGLALSNYGLLASVILLLSRLSLGNRSQRLDLAKKVVKAEYEHSRLIALINSMSDGVIATDDAGIILTYNAAALDLLDTNKTLTGASIRDFLPLQDEKGAKVDIVKVASETNYLQRISSLSMPLGPDDKIDLDISISRIMMATSLVRQQGFTFLMRDITQQKSLDEERDLFISEVSHELRTPITIAEGNMSMAQLQATKTPLDPKGLLDSINKSHEQIVFLADMVNDLSALSRAQREDKSMELENFQVSEVLTELAQTYTPQAQKKNLFLHVMCDEGLPQLTTSRLYFKEIMQNFVTNAIKYTQEGGVTVHAHVTDQQEIIIDVQDTGIGIAKSELEKVYEKFWRSEDPLTRQTGGTGLGLFITAKLAHRLGAHLKLDSKLKEGTTFSLVVPTVAAQAIDQKNVVKNEVANIFQ